MSLACHVVKKKYSFVSRCKKIMFLKEGKKCKIRPRWT
jgi:hypothetical protein